MINKIKIIIIGIQPEVIFSMQGGKEPEINISEIKGIAKGQRNNVLQLSVAYTF
jgi:hypothetical protein